jgi:DNA-binding response OmpR family regulator
VKKILVIENDLDTLDMIGFLFEDSGYEVMESQFKIPIEKILHDDPDLIILDYWLDDGYGSDVCLELKAHPFAKHTPIILISADPEIKQMADDCRADGYISKPFDIADLETLVKKLVK